MNHFNGDRGAVSQLDRPCQGLACTPGEGRAQTLAAGGHAVVHGLKQGA